MLVDAVRSRQVLIDGTFAPATLRLRDGAIEAIEAWDAAVSGVVLEPPDAAFVVPGVVDTHVHVNEPGRTEWEGFRSATRAAGLGGATTLVDMPLNSVPPTTTVEALELKRSVAKGQLMVDVGFWGGAVPGNLADLEPLWDHGVFGFKCFLSPSGVSEFPSLDPEQFLAAMRVVAAFDGLMLVHAEDGQTLADTPAVASASYADFVASRPDRAEVVAIARVVDAARETGARVHIVHLSSARALDLIADARSEGLRLTVETCPHYLTFAAETIPPGAGQFKCCPPIRDAGNREGLWQALECGLIDTVVSDHSPAPASEKGRGDGDLQQAWGGVSGLQVGLGVMAHEAARRGVGLARVSEWMSTSTAALAGLARKGRIAVGADADLAVYDPTVELRVDAAELAHRHPISAYDGLSYAGSVTSTIVRGRSIDAADARHDLGQVLDRTGAADA